ncbi:MAG: MFS transporter [Candidatus Sericytochromatia bacterium]|nr:MFS transporter [Candidatus Sericytochromatia bacterium]
MTTAPVPPAGFAPLLRSPAFLALWGGQAASQLADRMVFVLLVELVTRHDASPGTLGVAIALTSAPTVLLGALAGAWADRLDQRRAMVASSLARAGLVLALGLLGPTHLAAAVGLAVLVAVAAQPFVPAEAAALPLVVPPDQLLQANAVSSLTMVGALVAGLLVGEPLVRAVGPGAAALGVAAAFAAAAACLRRVTYTQPAVTAPAHEPYLVQLREGLSYIRRRGGLRRTMACQVAIVCLFAAASVLAIVLARATLHVPYTWLMAAAGLGLGLGAWAVGRWGARWGADAAMTGGFLTCGVALVGLAAVGPGQALPALALATVLGAGGAVVGVPVQTRLQALVADGVRGKVFGVQTTLLNATAVVPLAGVGHAVEAVGLPAVLAALGAAAALTGLGAWLGRLRAA